MKYEHLISGLTVSRNVSCHNHLDTFL